LDGNRYVDFVNSWGPLVLGHAAPAVVEAIKRQAELGTSYGACSTLETDLAEIIISQMPNIEMLRFVNSGTEAGMSVIRLARAFTERQKIIKFAGCYHGHVDSLLVSAGSGSATFSIPDSKGVTKENAADTLVAEFNDLQSVSLLFEKNPGHIAAIIVEPIVGNAGFILPEENFHIKLRELCTKNGALLIFDEVMTGFRVALGGAQSLYNVKPDITMLGKVIGGGLPVGAFGGRKDIMSLLAPIGPVYQAGTLSGNPLAMAAGIATLKEWTSKNVFEETAGMAKTLCAAMINAANKASVPFQANYCGTMFGFFFQDKPVKNYNDAKKSDLECFNRFFHKALSKGIYFAQSQFEAGFISAAHETEALEYTLTHLEDIFADLKAQ
jgi:glutamate-1-semialdehyde 2,1-aminomutase